MGDPMCAVRAAADARLAGAPERETLPAILDALRGWDHAEQIARARIDESARQVATLHAAIDAMCRSCEPEGTCRDEACALRPVSPLPLARGEVRDIRPRAIDTPEGKAAQSARTRRVLAERWSDPAAREAASEAMRERWAGVTPEERAARGRRISEGKRRAAEVPA